jgi:aspartate kinase
MLLIQKFGGGCMAGPDRVRASAATVATAVRRGDEVVVTVSAMGEETDNLLRLASAVSGELPGRELDMLLSAGEHKATALLSLALHGLGILAEGLTGGEAGISTDHAHMAARVVSVRPARILAALARGHVPVVAGAQGVAPDGTGTFLGRGGSDMTAVALAAGLGADVCEIFTDAPGVFTADPAVVPGARLLRRVSARMLFEMCSAGYPEPAARAAARALDRRVPLRVRSPFSPEEGTWVGAGARDGEEDAVAVVAGLVSSGTATMSVISDRATGDDGRAAEVLAALAGAGIAAGIVSVSPTRVTCGVPAAAADRAIIRLHEVYVEQAAPHGVKALARVARGISRGKRLRDPGLGSGPGNPLAAKRVS